MFVLAILGATSKIENSSVAGVVIGLLLIGFWILRKTNKNKEKQWALTHCFFVYLFLFLRNALIIKNMVMIEMINDIKKRNEKSL